MPCGYVRCVGREGKGEHALNIRTRLWGTCSARHPRGEEDGHVVHHKQTHKGLFVVFETRGRGGDVPSTKTRHSGRVLMFEMSERGEGRVVFEMRGRGVGTHRAPQTRPCGRVWGVGDKEKEREHAEHQKHATWGVFLMFGMFGVFGTSMLGLYRARQGGEEVSQVGEGGRGANGTFSTCLAAVLNGS